MYCGQMSIHFSFSNLRVVPFLKVLKRNQNKHIEASPADFPGVIAPLVTRRNKNVETTTLTQHSNDVVPLKVIVRLKIVDTYCE